MQKNSLQANTPQAIVKGLQLFAKAQAFHAEKQYADADKHYRRALSLMPDHPNVLVAYAQLAEDAEDWSSAEQLYRKIGALRPNSNFEAKLATVLFKEGKFAEAIPFLEAHLSRNPAEANSLHALGNALSSTGRFEEGLPRARQAFALDPDPRYLDAVLNTLYHLARADELDACIDDALAQFPDSQEIRSMYALHTLKSGRYEKGFPYFRDLRWRNNLKAPPDAGTPGEWWDGSRFDGTLLIAAEQGIGDEIMGSSMFGDLVAMGQHAMIECDERLIPLYQRSYPTLEFVPRHQKQLIAAYNAGGNFRKINVLDMCAFFRKGLARFPSRRQWLQPDSERVSALRAAYQMRWPGKRKIGISWKSNRAMEGASRKNILVEDLLPLFAVPDCVFINLQYGDVADDVATLKAAGHELYIDPDIDTKQDIDGFAAQISALDLVVSISNTTVHVAGAQGVPCWMLLPKTRPILWYWGYCGDTTPWYPSLRLLRNSQDDDWSDLVASTAQELARLPVPES